MSKRFGVRLWPWIALVAPAALLAGGGTWLYSHWPARPVAVPGEADLVLRLAADGKVATPFGKIMHDPSTRDFKKLEDLLESRRQEKYKPPPDFAETRQ